MVRLEWIELFNRADYEIDLHDFIIIADSDTNSLPENSVVGAGSYVVLARQLLSENGSDSFEAYWGDGSGEWGDSYLENYAAYDGVITLGNSYGSIRLMKDDGTDIEFISWDQSSDDGRSIEKDDVYADFSGWHDCSDSRGSTPGQLNSPVPEPIDETFSVTVNPKTIAPGGYDNDRILIEVVIPSGSRCTIDVFDETGKKLLRLAQDASSQVFRLNWDGIGSDGKLLKPGPYFIGVFLSGQRSDSELVPIAVAP